MEWVAQNCLFIQLKTLSVYLTCDDKSHERPHYTRNAISSFQAFKSFKGLLIHSLINSYIIDTILSHYGQTLKKLSLHSFKALNVIVNA
jgi:hypothetical protein